MPPPPPCGPQCVGCEPDFDWQFTFTPPAPYNLALFYILVTLPLVLGVLRWWCPQWAKPLWRCAGVPIVRLPYVGALSAGEIGAALLVSVYSLLAGVQMWQYYMPPVLTNVTVTALPDMWDFPSPYPNISDGVTALVARALGHAGEVMLGVLLIPVTRNGLLVICVGVPFERAVRYHRWLGRAAVGLLLLHMVVFWGLWIVNNTWVWNALLFVGWHSCSWGDGNPTVGWATLSMLLMTLMLLTALDGVRRKYWNTFHVVHTLFAFPALCMATYHSYITGGFLAAYLIIAGTLHLADLVYRYGRALLLRPRHIQLAALRDGVTRLRYPRSALRAGRFDPGQYCFVCVPRLSWFEWHPFSISSSPTSKDEYVSHHIKALGSEASPNEWTYRLHALAAAGKVGVGYLQEVSTELLLIDGPYGAPALDIDACGTLLLVAGGIGITPLISQLTALHDAAIAGDASLPPKLKRVVLSWVLRHEDGAEPFESALIKVAEAPVVELDGGRTISFDLRLHHTAKEPRPSEGGGAPSSKAKGPKSGREPLVGGKGGSSSDDAVGVAGIEMKSSRGNSKGGDAESGAYVRAAGMPASVAGRPSYDALLEELAKQAGWTEQIAVWACGPAALTGAAEKAVEKAVGCAGQCAGHIGFYAEQFAF